jgi:signal transduction histidine kinase
MTPEPDAHTLLALSRAVTTARLFSGMIHQLHNALLVISGTVELLETRTDLPEPVARGLERIRRQIERTTQAISEVSIVRTADAGDPALVDMRELVERAVSLRRFGVARAGLTIETRFAGGATLVRGRAAHLQLVVLNVIIAAEDALATQPGGRIDVEWGGDDRGTRVMVSDTRGPAKLHDVSAFALFDNTRPGDLAGLGLAVARTLVLEHGGTFDIEPTTDGAAVVVRLPVAVRGV